MFISIDANWGSGKTFYVRQIEQTLNYLTRKSKGLPTVNIEPYFAENSILNSLKLNYTYFPVYYNAWLYDNHDDPLMSLVLTIVKQYDGYCETKLDCHSIMEKIATLADSFPLSFGGIKIGGNFRNLTELFQNQDILLSVKTEDEIRDCVKKIFDTVIVENVEKLVIFIDELDRCKPTYAIEMLERIKHYFEDDRIIFIASINREQLIHSISKVYGTAFDSTGYLDKFFDRNVYLPEIGAEYGGEKEVDFTDKQYHLQNITKGLNDYFRLSLRENLRFYEVILYAASSDYVQDGNNRGFLLSAFIPIITILAIKDENKKRRFLNGDIEILKELFENVSALYELACRFGFEQGKENEMEERFQVGYKKIEEFYNYSFGVDEKRWYKGMIDIDNFKELCLKMCNRFG